MWLHSKFQDQFCLKQMQYWVSDLKYHLQLYHVSKNCLHQCVLFWKAYNLDLNLTLKTSEPDEARCNDRAWFWSASAMGCRMHVCKLHLPFSWRDRHTMRAQDTDTKCIVLFWYLYWCAGLFWVEFGSLSPSPALPLLLVLAYCYSPSGTHVAQPNTFVENP